MASTLRKFVSLAVCAFAMLFVAVNASYTVQCSGGTCSPGPLMVGFSGASCEGEGSGLAMFNASAFPNFGANTCLTKNDGESQIWSCDGGSLRVKLWDTNNDCSGEPAYQTFTYTHRCYRSNDQSIAYICNQNDVNTPMTLPSGNPPSMSDPVRPQSLVTCPGGVCRHGYAHITYFNQSSTCGGNFQVVELQTQLGTCFRDNAVNPILSQVTWCDATVLRTYYYPGPCTEEPIGFSDIYRKPSACSLVGKTASRFGIECPTVNPPFPPYPATPQPSGFATSIPLPVGLISILLLVFYSSL